MLACPIQSWTRSTPNPSLNKCVAQKCFNTWKCRRCSGMPAAAPYFFINRWSVVRSIGRFCFDRKIGPGKDPRTLSQARPGLPRASNGDGRKTRETDSSDERARWDKRAGDEAHALLCRGRPDEVPV